METQGPRAIGVPLSQGGGRAGESATVGLSPQANAPETETKHRDSLAEGTQHSVMPLTTQSHPLGRCRSSRFTKSRRVRARGWVLRDGPQGPAGLSSWKCHVATEEAPLPALNAHLSPTENRDQGRPGTKSNDYEEKTSFTGHFGNSFSIERGLLPISKWGPISSIPPPR